MASRMAVEMMLPPTFNSVPSCSGAILPIVRYAAGTTSSANSVDYLSAVNLSRAPTIDSFQKAGAMCLEGWLERKQSWGPECIKRIMSMHTR